MTYSTRQSRRRGPVTAEMGPAYWRPRRSPHEHSITPSPRPPAQSEPGRSRRPASAGAGRAMEQPESSQPGLDHSDGFWRSHQPDAQAVLDLQPRNSTAAGARRAALERSPRRVPGVRAYSVYSNVMHFLRWRLHESAAWILRLTRGGCSGGCRRLRRHGCAVLPVAALR